MSPFFSIFGHRQQAAHRIVGVDVFRGNAFGGFILLSDSAFLFAFGGKCGKDLNAFSDFR
jgi:hypothetical protein